MSQITDAPEMKRYSLKLKTVTFEVETTDGRVERWLLKELTGAQRDDFLNVQKSKIKVVNGNAEVIDHKGLTDALLALCVYDESGKIVDPRVIKTWPSQMQLDLFLDAMSLSGLDQKKAMEEAKNV